MSTVTGPTKTLRMLIEANRPLLQEVLDRYHAENPRVFGSVARGDARVGSNVDLLVDLVPGAGNELLRVAGIGEEFGRILHVGVDVVTFSLLREPVSAEAYRDAVAL